ncbi:hypothetical protein DICVIV_13694 [Dictyocaulus viviparus]|uniref:Uncharacterized protein n=1 Tax=Dictyocaulus viviparus TaxID=29172 RepID=A0A0D8X9Q3_DICVI|nr:hypothetical protein DICVIV_13694 [Dictyocaulus viviparus]
MDKENDRFLKRKRSAIGSDEFDGNMEVTETVNNPYRPADEMASADSERRLLTWAMDWRR